MMSRFLPILFSCFARCWSSSSSSPSFSFSSSSSSLSSTSFSSRRRSSMTMASCRCIVFLCLIFFVNWNHGADELKMRIEPQGEPIWFMEDHPLNLTCIAEKSATKPEWWKEGLIVDKESLTEKETEDGWVHLQFYKKEANEFDAGMYMCAAGTTDATTRVDMFTVTSRDVNLTIGFATPISCDVEPFYEKKSIRWLKDKKPVHEIADLEGRINLAGSNKTLTIINSKTSDTGVYTCIIEFNPGTVMEQVFSQSVGILGKPYIKRTRIRVTNTSVILECPAAGYPAPEVFWLRQEHVIEASDDYQLEAMNDVPSTKLIIKGPKAKAEETYVCTAENSMGFTKKFFTITNESNESCSLRAYSLLWSMVLFIVLWEGASFRLAP